MKIALPEQLPKPPDAVMAIWVIYDHPLDFPQGFVLRAQFPMNDGSIMASEEAWYASTADELRSIIPMGLVKLLRSEADDPAILETWL